MACVLGVQGLSIVCTVIACVLACIGYASLLHIVLDPEVLEGDQADAKDWAAQGRVLGDLYGSSPGERRLWELDEPAGRGCNTEQLLALPWEGLAFSTHGT